MLYFESEHLIKKNIPTVEMHYAILESALPSAFCPCYLLKWKKLKIKGNQ